MIKTELNNHIGIIILARPWVHNAINGEMMAKWHQILTRWSQDDQVKLVLITGDGDTFCAGEDVEEWSSGSSLRTRDLLHQMKRVLNMLYDFPKPTIAAINGSAFGGGCEIATACDFRLAHADLELGFTHIKDGYTAGWGGATRLFQLLPRSKALELLCTGKKVDSTTAHQIGLVDHILPAQSFMEYVLQWSEKMMNHSLHALMAYKQTVVEHDGKQNEKDLHNLIDAEVERAWELRKDAERTVSAFRFGKRMKKSSSSCFK